MKHPPAELHLAFTAAAADQLWETLGAISVSKADGQLVAGFPSRFEAEAAAVIVGGEVVELDPQDNAYLDLWRAWAKPFRTGRLGVRPAWHETLGAEVEVAIDAGHAFGHGAHPTTALVLTALEAHLRGGERILDIGCGSGVLAIAALALGASSVVALDIDPTAVTVTQANAEANGVADRLTVSSAPLAKISGAFDVVLANIGVVVLRELAPLAAERVGAGGWLVLSGLLDHQWAEVVAVVPGFELINVAHDDGWATPLLRRPVVATQPTLLA